MFVNKILRHFCGTEGSDQTGRTESLPTQGFSDHLNGWEVDEAPGFVSVGSSGNAPRESPWFYVLAIHPNREGSAIFGKETFDLHISISSSLIFSHNVFREIPKISAVWPFLPFVLSSTF